MLNYTMAYCIEQHFVLVFFQYDTYNINKFCLRWVV
jgi:hypothetical protein